MVGYCMKCKASREMGEVKYETTKNGKPISKGICMTCGTKMAKLGKVGPVDKLKEKFDGD